MGAPRIVFLVLLVMVASLACHRSGSPEQSRKVQSALLGVNVVETTDHTEYPNGEVGRVIPPGCSGALIQRHVVLTAAHCVDDPNPEYRFWLPTMGGQFLATDD
ncbi:MAG TPA: trypsin-like serine protease [Polyangiaceae bacterium]|jgi:V8-like Glu-specific endopeptidase